MANKQRFRGGALGLLLIVLFPGLFIALFFFAEQHFATLPYYGPYHVSGNDTVYNKVIDFEFNTVKGSKVSDESMLGNIYIAEFFHSESRIRLIEEEFRNENDVQFVSHTLDTSLNNSDALLAYAELIKADTEKWHFVVVSNEELFDVAINGYFNNLTTPDTIKQMLYEHNVFVLVDKEGLVRGIYDGGFNNEALISEIKRVEEEIRLLKKHYDADKNN